MSGENNQELIRLMEGMGWRFKYGSPENYFVYSTAHMTEKVAGKILKEVEKAYDEGFNACINEQCDQEKLKKQYENEIKKAELRGRRQGCSSIISLVQNEGLEKCVEINKKLIVLELGG